MHIYTHVRADTQTYTYSIIIKFTNLGTDRMRVQITVLHPHYILAFNVIIRVNLVVAAMYDICCRSLLSLGSSVENRIFFTKLLPLNDRPTVIPNFQRIGTGNYTLIS